MQPAALSQDHVDELLDLIVESAGWDLSAGDFREAVGLLLEDVPGFETAAQDTVDGLAGALWDHYRAGEPGRPAAECAHAPVRPFRPRHDGDAGGAFP